MPHLRVEYTPNIEADGRIGVLCQTLLRTLVALQDDSGKPVFPISGTRVLAWPAAHGAVADGAPDRAFVWLQLRINPGRSAALKKKVGDALMAAIQAHFGPVAAERAFGLRLQIDEGAEVYDGKLNNLAEHLVAHAAT